VTEKEKRRDYFTCYMIAFYYCVTWAGVLSVLGKLTPQFAIVITAALAVSKIGDSLNYRCKNKRDVQLKNGAPVAGAPGSSEVK